MHLPPAMAPESTEQAPSLRSKPTEGVNFEPHPELLMAARRGDWEQLERLLSQKDDASAAPQPVPPRPARPDVIVRIEEAADVEPASTVTSAEAVTVARDSVLHVVASRGDADRSRRRRWLAAPMADFCGRCAGGVSYFFSSGSSELRTTQTVEEVRRQSL